MRNFDDLLALGRLGGAGQFSQYLGPDRRKRRRYGLLDQAPDGFEQEIMERVKSYPSEGARGSQHGALQWWLDLIDLPRNAIANLVNLAVGAEPRRKQKGLAGLPVVSAGDILDKLGISATKASGGHNGGRVVDFIADFMGNVAMDPLSWATLGTSGLFGSAGRKVGQTVLTEAGEKALGRSLRQLQGRAAKGMRQRVLAQTGDKLAAREAARAALSRPAERAGRKLLEGVSEGLPTGKLGREYMVNRGTEALRERLAKRLVKARPDLEDVNWLGVTTRGLKAFHPTDLPAALLGIPARMLAPGVTQKYLGPGYDAFKRATHPFVNPLKFLPAADKTLVTRQMAAKLGLGRLGKAVAGQVGRMPGVGPLAEGVRKAGREIRERFDPNVIPPRAGDAEDQLRYEVERFERFSKERTARRAREVAYTEVPKLKGWIAQAAKNTGLDEKLVEQVGYYLGEAMEARESLENIGVRVRRMVRAGGGKDEQAEKLVRFIPKLGADLAPARAAKETVLAEWQNLPCRRKRGVLSPRKFILATFEHAARYKGKLATRRSPVSETIYLGSPDCELRISDHELGYADYGSRQQRHHGPELVLEASDELPSPPELCDWAAQAVRGWDANSLKQRQSAAKLIGKLRGLRAQFRKTPMQPGTVAETGYKGPAAGGLPTENAGLSAMQQSAKSVERDAALAAAPDAEGVGAHSVDQLAGRVIDEASQSFASDLSGRIPESAGSVKGTDEFSELWHDRPPTVEKNLWGETIEQKPRQGLLFGPEEIEGARLPRAPKPGERVEITDGLRQMAARVLPTIPGRGRPSAKVMRKELIAEFGSGSVQQQMRGRLHGTGWEPEIEEAIDQTNKGMWLFGEGNQPTRQRGSAPDLAPARRLGQRVNMVDGDLNDYSGELAVVDMKMFGTDVVASHAPLRRSKAAGGMTLQAMRQYPEGFQARMREAEASVKQVRGIAANPKHELLLEFGNDVTGGPPVTFRMDIDGRPTDVVIQGNGRVAGMAAWRAKQWKAYRAELEKIVGPIDEAIKKPMLVRRLEGTVEQARQLAARGQQAATLRETQIERARAALNALGADVENIPAVRIRKPVTRENVQQFMFDNPEFQEWLLGNVAPTKREQIMAGGEELAERVNDVFTAMLPRSVQELAGALPEKMEAMFTALAPQAAYLHSLRRAGRIHPHYDLYPALENAALLYGNIRKKRGSYAGMVEELDRIAATPTFAGMEDELSGATQRGMAMAVGMSRAARARDPSQTMLDGINRVVAAALEDDPKQMGLVALDPADTAAQVYARAFLPESVAENVLGKMRAIASQEKGFRVQGSVEELGDAQTERAVSDLRKAGVQAHGGAEGETPTVGVGAETPPGGGPPETLTGQRPVPHPDRERVYADLDRDWGEAGRDRGHLAAMKIVLDNMDDDIFAGLRFEAGTAEQAAELAQQTGKRPAAAYMTGEQLTAAEQASLKANSVIRLFQHSEDYDDFGLFLEELSHHGYRNVHSNADRALIEQWYGSKTPEQWAEVLRARGVRPEQAEYYAGSPIELYGRYWTDYVMGSEVETLEPAVRSLFRKALDAIAGMWRRLIDTGGLELGTDRRIAELIERHYAPPGGRLGAMDESLGLGMLEPGSVRAPAPMGRQMRFGEPLAPVGPPGKLEMDDPMRQLVEHVQARGGLRVVEEQAAGVPARRLTTQREIGYLQRILGDRKTRFGRWSRRKGMSIKNARQIMRERDREKFVHEINDLVEEVNRFQRGESPGDAKVLETVQEIGLGPGQELTPYMMDPVMSHVARELESVRTIGSAEMLRGMAEMFGVRVVRGKKTPSGYVPANAKQFGDITRGFVFKPEAAAVIERHMAQWQRPSQILRGYRRLLNLWKGWALFAPAYHLRNLFGNVFNSMLGEGYSGRAFSEGMEIVQAVASGKGLDRRIAGTGYTYGSLYKKLAVDHGKIGCGFFGVEFDTHRNRVEQIIEAIANPPGGRRAVELMGRGHPLLFNRTIGMMAEDASKVGFVITRLRRGDELAPAVERMVKHLFDYSELTDFERGAAGLGMRDIMPFYTWARKNSQLLLQVALTEPRKLAIIPKIQLTAERHLAGDETLPWELRPAHIMKEAGVQLSGGLRPKYANIGYMLPIGELPLVNPLRPIKALKRWAEQTGGPARTAAELLTNRDPYFGRKIKDYPGQRKQFLGVDMPPAAKHIARTIRPINFAEQVRRMAKGAGTPGEAAAGIVAQTSGARVFPVSVPRQVYQAERGVNEQVGAVRRDMKRRLYQLSREGGDPLTDGELRRLLELHEQMIERREGLPGREIRAQGREQRRSRRERFEEYLAEARTRLAG